MRVIGTAGHVDHGKSTLIAALTGTHPDRLKEEQAREMTIELGFGWLTLPGGEEVGIVDVPGHRDFIENMLAGVGGIDAAVLVIAVDEGVMPQTREHLAILDLLQVPAGVVAITKCDLINDQEWIDALEADVRDTVKGTVLENAPVLRVSARTRAGLPQLVATLEAILQRQPGRPDLMRPRLPIDRAFSMSGFGTVVTGTLTDGHLALGDEIEVLPSGLTGRIRGLQTHKKKEDQASPGSRTAVNISGISTEQIRRGEVLVRPGQYAPTRRLDAQMRLLPDVSAALLHNTEVKVFTGTAETLAQLRLLGVEQLAPGEQGWIQLELRDPVVAVRGDRYILRRPSPGETLGGGVIVDPHPRARHKRFDAQVLASLSSLIHGSPADVLLEAALALNATSLKEVVARSRLEASAGQQAAQELLASGKLLWLEDSGSPENRLVIAQPHWEELRGKAERAVSSFHGRFPLRGSMPREELKSRLELSARVFNALVGKLVAGKELVELGSAVARPGHAIHLDAAQQERAQALLRKFAQSPFSPPTVKESQAEAGEDLVNALVALGELMPVSAEVIFRKADYDAMVARVRAALSQQGRISLAEVRDLFGTSRKYAQALLEHLDATGITRRDGDYRKLR